MEIPNNQIYNDLPVEQSEAVEPLRIQMHHARSVMGYLMGMYSDNELQIKSKLILESIGSQAKKYSQEKNDYTGDHGEYQQEYSDEMYIVLNKWFIDGPYESVIFDNAPDDICSSCQVKNTQGIGHHCPKDETEGISQIGNFNIEVTLFRFLNNIIDKKETEFIEYAAEINIIELPSNEGASNRHHFQIPIGLFRNIRFWNRFSDYHYSLSSRDSSPPRAMNLFYK